MDQQFTMTIGSDVAEIPGVTARLDEVMQVSRFSNEAILDTQLAVEEAITNIIIHGYRVTGGKIEISFISDSNRVEIQIADSAPRFDPLSVPEPNLDRPLEERSIGGLGIFLIRQVMDEVTYQYRDGKNILALVKKREWVS